MQRRELLRLLNMAGAFFIAPPAPRMDWERLADPRIDSTVIDQYAEVNTVLWQHFSSATTKARVLPAVREHLETLIAGVRQCGDDSPLRRRLSALTADALQLTGEILFDTDKYTEAAHCYTLYPGQPKPGYIAPWDDTPEWERAAATAVYEQVRAFIDIAAGQTTKLTREQKGRFVATCWIAQIHKHIPDPKPSYTADRDQLPQWQKETDADVFEHIENNAE
jgi:hypothetical protein